MTRYEKYQNGLHKLKENEYIENEQIKTKEIIPTKEELIFLIESQLKQKRETELEKGTYFEGKLIKGRTQDIADALGQLKNIEDGNSAFWAFSSGEIEIPITEISRMKLICESIGHFRSSQFAREAELRKYIKMLTLEDLQTFDVNVAW